MTPIRSPFISDRQINPHTLTDREWRRLASMAGLKAEDWGEAWLELQRVYSGDNHLTHRDAVNVLKHRASLTIAKENLQAQLLQAA